MLQGVGNIDFMQNTFHLPLGMLFHALRTPALRLALWDAGRNVARHISMQNTFRLQYNGMHLCIMYYVLCIMYHVLCIMYYVLCVM